MCFQALSERLDQSLEILSVKLAELIKLTAIQEIDVDIQNYNNKKINNNNISNNSSTNSDNIISSDLTVATDGVSMVNNHTRQLIKSVQDLLVLTRTIRETWLLNQIPNNSRDSVDHNNTTNITSNEQLIKQQEIDYKHVESLIDKAINTIIN